MKKPMDKRHGTSEFKQLDAYCNYAHQHQRGDRFGRMFQLAPLYNSPGALRAIGAVTGPMNDQGVATRTSTVDVGQIFFGQFIDHDITLDVSSSLTSVVSDVSEIENVRTPTLDLDSIYGQGPEASRYLYHGTGDFTGVKLLTGADGTAADQTAGLAAEDLARSSDGTAIIGDFRNDENRIISQMQLAMIRFHNAVVDTLAADHDGSELYEEARRLTTWHYQWVVLNDFLVSLCGSAVVDDVLGNGRQFYCHDSNDPFIPVEFSVAAYRFGHSMIPLEIQIQENKSALGLFGTKLGMGFKPLKYKDAVVDWHELARTSANRVVQKAEKLDAKLASILLELPFITPPAEQSLATRNLLRGQAFMLPSGEVVADAMDRPEAEITQVSARADNLAADAGVDLNSGTPLWLYILLEAEEIGRETHVDEFDAGEGLGPVGARIVTETIFGLMELDPRSFLAQDRSWSPTASINVRTLGEMLTFAP